MPIDVVNALLQLLNLLPALQSLPVLQALLLTIQILTAQGLSPKEIQTKLIQKIKLNNSSLADEIYNT